MADKNIAVVDMGTNSFHLIIAAIDENENINIKYREREVIRLASHESTELNHISDDEINLAIKILMRFKKLAEKYNTKLRAVATSAVREADNKDLFLKKIFDATEVSVEVIQGNEEAKLIFQGIKKALPINDKKVLCIDIGGGSTEFVYADNGEIKFAESIKIGAVRLSKKFFPDYLIEDLRIKKCEEYIAQKLTENLNINFGLPIELGVGSSGTVQSVASMINSNLENTSLQNMNGYKIREKDFAVIFEKIIQLKSTEARLNVKGLEQKRADIIPAGLLILKKTFELFGLTEIVVSEYALREGILLNTFRTY